MSARRLRHLIAGIPHESALGVALDVYHPGWSNAEELLALLAELQHDHSRLFIVANSKKGTPVPKPLHINRPRGAAATDADRGVGKRPATSDELVRWFGGRARYSGKRHGRARCEAGHFVRAGAPCSRCGTGG